MNSADPGLAALQTAATLSSPDGLAPAGAERPAPLWATLLFTFVNSVCGGAVGIGVFFIARQAYDLPPVRSFALGALGGLIYVLGALAVGPLLAGLIRSSPRVTTRRALIGLMLTMAGACALAFSVQREWTLWGFIVIYQAASGALWPIVESYLSGGRRGAGLRSAVGRFNICWAGAIALSFWLMAYALKDNPLAVFGGVALLHLLMIAALGFLPSDPARHVHDEHEPHPASYAPLLRTSRWLLALSYLLMYGVSPALPAKVEAMGVLVLWQTPLVSAWMLARVLVFALMERWHGWHGKWWTPAAFAGATIAGFVLVVLADRPLPLLAGLVLFGTGVGGLYCAALYYAMEVGSAEVGAGGKHEATIGAGMTLGPAAGAAAWLIASGATGAAWSASALFLVFTGVLTVFALALAARPWLRWRRNPMR